MARFVRKIPVRLKRMKKKSDGPDAAASVAKGLLKDYKVPTARRDLVLLRLQVGLQKLYANSSG